MLIADRLRAANEYANEKATRRPPIVAFSNTVVVYHLHDTDDERSCVPENLDGVLMRCVHNLFKKNTSLRGHVTQKLNDVEEDSDNPG